jgi:hypothetical protein
MGKLLQKKRPYIFWIAEGYTDIPGFHYFNIPGFLVDLLYFCAPEVMLQDILR